MIIARGIIKPNNNTTHFHGALAFYREAPREFYVDDKLEADEDSGALHVGEKFDQYIARTKPLALTVQTYEALKAKNGGALVIEPAAVEATSPARSKKVSDLEAQIEALKAQLAAKAEPAP